jgi:hypothetical protein
MKTDSSASQYRNSLWDEAAGYLFWAMLMATCALVSLERVSPVRSSQLCGAALTVFFFLLARVFTRIRTAR